MSERDELLAEAERRGIPVDKRLGARRLREAIAEWDDEHDGQDDDADEEDVTSRDWGDRADDEPHEDAANDPTPAAGPDETPDDGWPRRIAPCAWLDQDGNRWTDLGQAAEAADRIRQRSGA